MEKCYQTPRSAEGVLIFDCNWVLTAPSAGCKDAADPPRKTEHQNKVVPVGKDASLNVQHAELDSQEEADDNGWGSHCLRGHINKSTWCLLSLVTGAAQNQNTLILLLFDLTLASPHRGHWLSSIHLLMWSFPSLISRNSGRAHLPGSISTLS